MTEAMQHAREVGLKVLQPSQRDLDHGLALHRESVVCDAYGFAPNAALDGDAVKAALEAGASELELQDLTEDMSMTRCVSDPREREEWAAAWEAAGVTCILQNAGAEGQSVKRIIKRLARFTYVTDFLPDILRRAPTPDDIEAAKREEKHCLYVVGNGVPIPEDWASVEEELRYIRVFFQLGIRMMHLTYNRRNMIGDGCAEPANGGLSDFGRAVVEEMNRVGVIVDCAHSGWQTSLEAAQASSRPMVASHSVCADLNYHCRGKPDEVIRAICDTGGYIGICCVPAFLGHSGDLNALLDHIDHVVHTFGVDHVAIGTDAAHTSSRASEEYAKIPARRPARSRWEGFWPQDDALFDPQWQQEDQRLSMAWTNWPLFTVGLVQRGYSDEEVQKIIGGNVLRVARAALSRA
jgi:membrane dipeptidase